jgi:hypothetical protein
MQLVPTMICLKSGSFGVKHQSLSHSLTYSTRLSTTFWEQIVKINGLDKNWELQWLIVVIALKIAISMK